jgi:CheY-like chemotaxis protein
VSDDGCGIPRDFLGSVFEPFRQADASTTRRQGGLGLGLSIVKHLVEAHGGSISVESEGEGRGATFLVALPIVPDPARPGSECHVDEILAGAQAGSDPSALDGIAVLVVDDDEECREVIAAHLEQRHAVVLTAASSSQAFDLLQREHVDVLLADIAMPDEDGYALVRRIRQSTASANAWVPAAAVTALARSEDQHRAIDAGFQLHLSKPIDERSLVSAVATLNRLNLLQGR